MRASCARLHPSEELPGDARRVYAKAVAWLSGLELPADGRRRMQLQRRVLAEARLDPPLE